MAAAELDVSGLTCPLTWVKTRIALERLAPGDTLSVHLPRGEALESVPRSAREAGHDVALQGETLRIVRRST